MTSFAKKQRQIRFPSLGLTRTTIKPENSVSDSPLEAATVIAIQVAGKYVSGASNGCRSERKELEYCRF